MPHLRPVLDRMLSRSVLGTVLVFAGGVIVLAGSLYGVALVATELLSAPATGATPARSGTPLTHVAVVLLFGAAVATLGGQLLGYAR